MTASAVDRSSTRLSQLAIGACAAQALFAANELGVFALLHRRGPLPAADVATELGASADATRRLLGALVALGLVTHVDRRFANSGLADAHLVPDRSGSMATWVSLCGHWSRVLGGLGEAVRSGETVAPPPATPADAESLRAFVLGMHDYAIGPGSELVDRLDLAGRARLLDVGGGPGSYSILLAERWPGLSCVVFDLPDVVAVADEVIARHELSGRVSTVAGDYHADPLPRGFDVVLVSNVLHQEDRAECARILGEAHRALEPGGVIAIQGMFLDDGGDGPVWPAVLDLLMLTMCPGGRAYSAAETRSMLTAAGFERPKVHEMSMFNPASLMTATRT